MTRTSRLATAVAAGVVGLGLANASQGALVLYWDFEEGSGTTALDRSGNNRNGTLMGTTGTPTYVNNPPGLNSSTRTRALDFVKPSAQRVVSTPPLQPADLNIDGAKPKTIAAWANTQDFTGQGGIWEIGNNANQADFSLRTRAPNENVGGDNAWRAQFWGGDVDFSVPNSKDNWVHFAMVHDPADPVMKQRIYANGVEVATGNFALNTQPAAAKPFSVGVWNVGNPPAAANDQFFEGLIDDVAVYDQALTPVQVAALAAGVSPIVVPEPASLGLLGGGAGLLLMRRRRRSASR